MSKSSLFYLSLALSLFCFLFFPFRLRFRFPFLFLLLLVLDLGSLLFAPLCGRRNIKMDEYKSRSSGELLPRNNPVHSTTVTLIVMKE